MPTQNSTNQSAASQPQGTTHQQSWVSHDDFMFERNIAAAERNWQLMDEEAAERCNEAASTEALLHSADTALDEVSCNGKSRRRSKHKPKQSVRERAIGWLSADDHKIIDRIRAWRIWKKVSRTTKDTPGYRYSALGPYSGHDAGDETEDEESWFLESPRGRSKGNGKQAMHNYRSEFSFERKVQACPRQLAFRARHLRDPSPRDWINTLTD